MSAITKSIVVAALTAVALATSPGVASGLEAEERRGAELLREIERGEASMHEVMGIRFSGCGSPRFPRGAGGVIGPMGMMGGFGPGGMMGGRGFDPGERGRYGPPRAGEGDRAAPGRRFGPGARMGFHRDRDGVPSWLAIVSLILLAAALIAVLLLLARPRSRRRGSDPLDLLAERFARGEIGAEEYAERRRLLEGGSR